jgi:hypothetical protein
MRVKAQAVLQQLMQDDALADEVVFANAKGEKRTLREIVVYENERRLADGSWSSDGGSAWKAWEVQHDDGQPYEEASVPRDQLASSTSSTSTREQGRFETIHPPKGFVWVEHEDWTIDRVGLWTSQRQGSTDADGWAVSDADGRLLPPSITRAGGASRRRRWYRRMVSVPTY